MSFGKAQGGNPERGTADGARPSEPRTAPRRR